MTTAHSTPTPRQAPAGPRRTGRPKRRRRAPFGSTRQLASGRWQARYLDHDGHRRTAPRTFASKGDALDWIATNRADLLRGTWHSPDLGTQALGTYATDWLAMRVDLAPRTRAHYAGIIPAWIAADLPHPLGTHRPPINLGRVPLRQLTPTLVREWHAAATLQAQHRAQERAQATIRHRRTRAVHAARTWARSNGIPVADSGRLPQRVLDAWAATGDPQVH